MTGTPVSSPLKTMPYPRSAETLAGIFASEFVWFERSVGTSMIKVTPRTTAITKFLVKLSLPGFCFELIDLFPYSLVVLVCGLTCVFIECKFTSWIERKVNPKGG